MKDGEKIRLLYEFTLNRAADVDGYNHYVALLRGGASLSDLARTMLDSDEFRVSRGVVDDVPFVYSLYLNGLDRRGSMEEVGAWVDYLREGRDMGDVVSGFVLSAEAATTIGQPEPYREG
jgi:serralysin